MSQRSLLNSRTYAIQLQSDRQDMLTIRQKTIKQQTNATKKIIKMSDEFGEDKNQNEVGTAYMLRSQKKVRECWWKLQITIYAFST